MSTTPSPGDRVVLRRKTGKYAVLAPQPDGSSVIIEDELTSETQAWEIARFDPLEQVRDIWGADESLEGIFKLHGIPSAADSH